jgi:hypothetical protein
LLLDLYLLVREGLRAESAGKTSRWTVGFLRLSPVIMMVSAFILGLIGSGLREAMRGE